MTRPRGTIVLKTTLAEGAQLNLTGAVVKELTLVGSRCGPFERAIEALEAGRVDVVPLIDSCYPLDRGVEALARAAAPGVLKVLLASS
jgi:threonine dehydrogenase-like Zn-dependent dehydrogenase